MTTEQHIYSEVRNSLKSYDEAGLIDPIDLRTWLHGEIKRFGTNLMIETDDIIQVKKGKAELPKDFWALQEVWKYELSHYCMDEDSPITLRAAGKDHLLGKKCDCNSNTESYMKEKVYYKDKEILVFYNTPKRLRLAPGFNRRAVTKDCINLPMRVQKRDKNQVQLLNQTLQLEFSEGFLYIRYRAMPMDEEGNLIIPETQHDRLRIFLEYHLKRKLIETWVFNNDDPNLINKLQYIEAKENEALELAMTEIKAKVLDPAVWKSLRNRNRRLHRRFEEINPRFDFNRFRR